LGVSVAVAVVSSGDVVPSGELWLVGASVPVPLPVLHAVSTVIIMSMIERIDKGFFITRVPFLIFL
jgi:hypothetical protein